MPYMWGPVPKEECENHGCGGGGGIKCVVVTDNLDGTFTCDTTFEEIYNLLVEKIPFVSFLYVQNGSYHSFFIMNSTWSPGTVEITFDMLFQGETNIEMQRLLYNKNGTITKLEE